MKKLITTNIVEGVRKLGAVRQIFEHMEAAYTDAISELIYGICASSNGPIALYGCVNSGSGSTYNISAGAIFRNGEVFSIPAFSGTAGGGQVPVLGLVESKTQLAYTDGSNQDTLNTRTLAWSFGTSGSGLADFSALVTLKTRINSNLLDVPGQISAAVAALVDSSPAALDTLNELAAALGDDANFATTVTNALASKAPLASPALTGNPTAPNQSAGTNNTRIANTAYVNAVETLLNAAIALKAPLASPALTGTPTAPTASPGTNTTQISTTAFVQATITAAIAALVDSSPSALDTLNELAAALGDDANFATTVTNALSGKVSDTGDTMTGSLEISGATAGLNTDNVTLKVKKVAFTGWNMDADVSKNVAHGLTDQTKITRVWGKVINNAGNAYSICGGDFGGGDFELAAYVALSSTNVTLVRKTGGGFDDAAYNNASGVIYIEYEV